MFDAIFQAIEVWMRTLLTSMVKSNLQNMFAEVNQSTADIATRVGQTPQGWNGSIFSMIRNLSNTVILPIAGMVITFVVCYELISMLTEKNNMHDIDTWMFFKYIFKMMIAVYLLSNTYTITMAIFDLGQHVVNSAAGVISNETAIDVTQLLANTEAAMVNMELGELVLLALETILVNFGMKIMSMVITVACYGRMIEIYLYTSVAPIPFATLTNREWGQIGNNYLRGLFAIPDDGMRRHLWCAGRFDQAFHKPARITFRHSIIHCAALLHIVQDGKPQQADFCRALNKDRYAGERGRSLVRSLKGENHRKDKQPFAIPGR